MGSNLKRSSYSNNTIYLDEGDDAIYKIFVHEFTHYLEQTAEYAGYAKAVLRTPMVAEYVKNLNIKGVRTVNDYIELIIKAEREVNGRIVSRQHAECELVAHFTTDVLFNRDATFNVYDEFLGTLKKYQPESERGFVAAIKSFFRKIRDLVKGSKYERQFTNLENRFLKMVAEVEQKYGSSPDVYTDTQQKTAAEGTAGGVDNIAGDEWSYIEIEKNKRSRYNEFNTIVMQWAYSASTNVGDVRVFNRNGKEFVLLEATNDGYIELGSGTYKEVYKEYEQLYSQKDRSLDGYIEEIRSTESGDFRNLQPNREGENDSRNRGQIGGKRFQSNTARNSENLRASNKGEQLECGRENFEINADTNMQQKTAAEDTAGGVDVGEEKSYIVVLENGNTYVKANRKVINGETKSEQRKEITKFFKTLLKNKPSLDIQTIEGDVLTITKAETANKARDDYKTYNGRKVKLSDGEFTAKLHAASHIDELVETSLTPNKPPQQDNKNHSFAKDGFAYRTAYFEDFDGQYYQVTISVGHNNNIATVYNIGKMKESVPSSAKIIAVVGSKALDETLPDNSIPNPDGNVNRNFGTHADVSTNTQQKTAAEDTAGGEKSYIDIDSFSTQNRGGNNIKTLVGVDGNIYENVVVVDTPKAKRINRHSKSYREYILNTIAKEKITVLNENGDSVVVEFAKPKERVKKDGTKHDHLVIGKLLNAKGGEKRLAILNIVEILKRSEPSLDANNNVHNHQWLDENGWDKRKSFVVTEDSVVYPVVLHIAKTKDGRNILYDVGVIIKEGIAADRNASYSHSNKNASRAVRTTTPYENRLSHKQGDVKKNIKTNPDEKSFLSLDDYVDDDSYERVMKRKNNALQEETEGQIAAIHKMFLNGDITESEMLAAENDVMKNLFKKVNKQTHNYVRILRDRNNQRAAAKKTRGEVKGELRSEMTETERKRVLRESIRRRVKSFTNTLNANTNTKNIPDNLKDLAKASIGLINEGRFTANRMKDKIGFA